MNSFHQLVSNLDIFTALNTATSIGLGLSGFIIALTLKLKAQDGRWFTFLRLILMSVTITAISNVYAILILGEDGTSPTQLCFNLSVLALLVWIAAYYRNRVRGLESLGVETAVHQAVTQVAHKTPTGAYH